MATVYKIHPAIGVARVGNSPDEFFIGPERVGEHPAPAGGFKDAQCRIKRQAARFRIFAHHDDDSVEEITAAEADIQWTVHLVNKKAAHPGRGNTESNADMTIDPGPRVLDGPNQIRAFDNGQIDFAEDPGVTVPLGEIRSDDKNRLLVLGGAGTAGSPPGSGIGDFWGNEDWYDDVSDGPITASITLLGSNEAPAVEGAWVIVTPPKFAPHIDNVVTLYDRVLQTMIDDGLANAPGATSYTRDVYPILQRARDTKWVESVGFAHSWADPVVDNGLRNAIFGRLTAPNDAGVDMPQLLENTADGRLTPTQYAHMERWKDGNFANDWVGVPAPEANVTPTGLDRAALEHCVGGAFFPGIEAGGRNAGDRPIVDPALYAEAFRFDHGAVDPGDISYTMALPWQADFNACADNWWPVPRPNDVTPQGQNNIVKWDRDVGGYEDMVQKWHTLGFVVQQGDEHVEVERCDEASITLMTPHLDFVDIPQGPLGMVREQPLAISFEVISADSPVTLEYAPGGGPMHAQLVAFNNSVTVGPTGPSQIATARLWVIFRTGAIGAIAPQAVVVRHAASAQEWTITITGNTVARQTAAVALVLDRSGSMDQDRGDGQSKHSSLQQAASIFVDVMLEGDGVGLVRYNQDAQPMQQVLALGDGGLADINRGATKDLINGDGLQPDGWTSIGDGIFEGRKVLNDAPQPYDLDALVVLTDGKENRSRYIADVAAEIDERTYAIGLGMPQNTSAPALQTISGNNGGYLLVTGAIGQDNRFLLQKYFLQILAGVSNAEVVLDPDGSLLPGVVQRIPFQLTDADSGVDVILLTPHPKIVDFRLQSPNGQILEPWRAESEPGMRYVTGEGVSYYRLVLPAKLVEGRFEQGGTWHALLTVGKPRVERSEEHEDGADLSILQNMFAAPRSLTRGSMSHAMASDTHLPSLDHLAEGPTAAEGPAAITEGQKRRQTVPYSLIVHSYSTVALRVDVEQDSFEPGALVRLQATLTASGIPFADDASVWAEVTRPDGSRANLGFAAEEDGRFSAALETMQPGVYHFRVRARGRSRRGLPFTRERTLTAAVWRGGDRDADNAAEGGNAIVDILRERDERLCELLGCLLTSVEKSTGKEAESWKEKGLHPEYLRKCLKQYCRKVARRGDDTEG